MIPVLSYPGKLVKVLKFELLTTTGAVINVCDLLNELEDVGVSKLEQLANYDFVIYVQPDVSNHTVISDNWNLSIDDGIVAIDKGHRVGDSFNDYGKFPFVIPGGAKFRYVNFEFTSWQAGDTQECLLEIFVFKVSDKQVNIPRGVAT